jgi:hypothetical protein
MYSNVDVSLMPFKGKRLIVNVSTTYQTTRCHILQVSRTRHHTTIMSHRLIYFTFLGVLEKLKWAPISFIMSVCPYAWNNLAPIGRNLHEIVYLNIFRKSVEQNSNFIKI